SSSSAFSCASRTMLADLRLNIRRTAHVLVACFAVIAVALGYWQIARSDLAEDPANPRVAEQRLYQPRGRILDRNGVVLASSESTSDGMVRRYPKPSLVHTIGFFSPRFGATNLEQAFDAELRGEHSPSIWER